MVDTLKTWWARLSPLPGGKWLFGKIINRLVPYTGTVSPQIQKLGPGYAEITIKDCRAHRNHLGSIHALALANLGEFTTGLALHFAMDSHDRAILTSLRTDFIKKARGRIKAIAETKIPHDHEKGILMIEANLFDEQANLVAKASASWLLEKITDS